MNRTEKPCGWAVEWQEKNGASFREFYQFEQDAIRERDYYREEGYEVVKLFPVYKGAERTE